MPVGFAEIACVVDVFIWKIGVDQTVLVQVIYSGHGDGSEGNFEVVDVGTATAADVVEHGVFFIGQTVIHRVGSFTLLLYYNSGKRERQG